MTLIPKILLLGGVAVSVALAWVNHGKRSQIHWMPAALVGVVEVALLMWSWAA